MRRFPPDTSVGFVYDLATQTFTTISYPGAEITSPYAINNAGAIGGFINYGGVVSGFELIASKYTRIPPVRAHSSFVTGISSSGELAGYLLSDGGTATNFLSDDGKYKKLVIPNAPLAEVLGVDGAGTAAAGYYDPSLGTGAGFVYAHKILTSLQFPGSSNTVIYGVNNAGEAVGYFFDASGLNHGLRWTPPAGVGRK